MENCISIETTVDAHGHPGNYKHFVQQQFIGDKVQMGVTDGDYQQHYYHYHTILYLYNANCHISFKEVSVAKWSMSDCCIALLSETGL